jgi:hypothetical protein
MASQSPFGDKKRKPELTHVVLASNVQRIGAVRYKPWRAAYCTAAALPT